MTETDLGDLPVTEARRPRLLAVWAALTGALLTLAIVLGVVLLVTPRPPAEGSTEATFVRDMLFHHEQAVEMALLMRDRSSDIDLRQFLLDMALTQQGQIGLMLGWLDTWGLPYSSSAAPMQGMGQMMGMATQTEINSLSTLPAAEAEVTFLQLMIRHHQGAVYMAEDALAHSDQPQVRRLAQSILDAQSGEITYMTELLRARGAEPLPTLERMQHP